MRQLVTRTLSLLALSVSFVASAPGLAEAQAPAVTDAQVDQYVRANLNEPAKIASAMAEYGVGLDRIQKATGFTRQQIVDYIEKSNNAALKAHLAAWNAPAPAGPAPQVTDAQIDAFIRANLKEPAKIAEAMAKFDVGLARIQRATGYTRQQIADYVEKSNNAYLKKELEAWNRSVSSPLVQAEYDALPDAMKGGYERNGQPILVVRDANEIDKLPGSMWRGMSAAQIASSKAQIRRALDGDADARGMTVLGINGVQVRIPAKADPAREAPPLSARELAALETQLKPLQDAVAPVRQRLDACKKQPKAKCEAELRAFDQARVPVFDLTATIAVARLELLPSSAPQQARFDATAQAAYTTRTALLTCIQTAALTGRDCRTHSSAAIKQAVRMETLAREMFTQCLREKTDCNGLRGQSDAMERTTREVRDMLPAFQQAQQQQAQPAGARLARTRRR